MPVVQILDNTKYEKALGILFGMGGLFRTRHFHVLSVGLAQYQALVAAGLVEPDGKVKVGGSGQKKEEGKAGRRGQKKKSV